MKRYIGFKYTKGQNTLPVHLLDGRIEKIISESLEYDTRMGIAVIDDTTRAAILSSVRNAVQSMPSGSIIPPILTQVYLRPFVREMIADEFPRLPVLSHLELPTHLNIQPIASITPDA
jgi:type III secretion protein V